MKKAFSYYRKSIERESEKSIEAQREEVHRYAKENGIEIVSEFEEVASSMTTDRQQLNQLFEALEENKNVDYVLVHRFDRMTRDMMDLGYIMGTLKKGKTRLRSCTEDNDYEDDPMKLFIIMMKTFGATMERIAIVERMQSGRKRKKENGGFIGGTPPMGYRAVMGSGMLEIEKSEIPIVEEVFRLREKGISMDKIATEINNQGFLTRKKKKFYATTIQRILKYEDWYKGLAQAPKIL